MCPWPDRAFNAFWANRRRSASPSGESGVVIASRRYLAGRRLRIRRRPAHHLLCHTVSPSPEKPAQPPPTGSENRKIVEVLSSSAGSHGQRVVPEYPIFSPISSQEGSRVAINPERVSSIIETGPRRVNINLPDGGTVTVAMTLEHVIAHLRGAHVAQEA